MRHSEVDNFAGRVIVESYKALPFYGGAEDEEKNIFRCIATLCGWLLQFYFYGWLSLVSGKTGHI